MAIQQSALRRLDAGESAFFQKQLEYVKRSTYDQKLKGLKAFDLFPISTEVPAGADTVTYRRYAGVGFAKIISDYSQDLPRSDVYGEEETVKVFSIGNMYGYDIKEIRRAQMAGLNLTTRKAVAARRANDAKINSIAFNGDTDHNISGFLNYSGISEYTVTADGTGSTKTWSTKTPDQIVRDMAGLASSIVELTNGVEIPDTLLLPLTKYNIIANTRMGDGSDTTILEFFLKANPYIKTIEWLNELEEAGDDSSARMMAYVNDLEHLSLELPLMFEQLPEQWEGFEAKIPCESETAGVIIYYPLSVAYGDGI